MPCTLSAMGDGSISRDSSLASSIGRISSAATFLSAVEAPIHVGASQPFPAGNMESAQRLGGPAVARAHRDPGLAGYSAFLLDLSRAHTLSHAGASTKTAGGPSEPSAHHGI